MRVEFDGGIGIVELLYRTNIIALVGGGDRPKWPKNQVMLWDDSCLKVIGELNFKSDVLAVRLRKDKIVVVLEGKIYIYNFHTRDLERKIETLPNPRGLIAMNGSKDMCVIATPSTKAGEVLITHFD